LETGQANDAIPILCQRVNCSKSHQKLLFDYIMLATVS